MNKETKTTPLDALAAQAQAFESAPVDGAPGQPAPNTEQDAQDAQSMAMVEAGIVSVLTMALKVGRAWIARKLPEIKDEWPDDLLEAPAVAAVPLLKKHLEKFMHVVGANPLVAAFAVSCVPLIMGLFNAMQKAEQREKREAESAKNGDPAPAAA